MNGRGGPDFNPKSELKNKIIVIIVFLVLAGLIGWVAHWVW